jgi:hypothetical protein
VLYSVIGWNVTIGTWTRVEGTPSDPNPNKPFAKVDVKDTFTPEGKLNPSITVIGQFSVSVSIYITSTKVLTVFLKMQLFQKFVIVIMI